MKKKTIPAQVQPVVMCFKEPFLSMNRKWFEVHKYLSNDEMLNLELIDLVDLVWVNLFRGST